MDYKYSLKDNFSISGSADKEFDAIIEDISARTFIVNIDGDVEILSYNENVSSDIPKCYILNNHSIPIFEKDGNLPMISVKTDKFKDPWVLAEFKKDTGILLHLVNKGTFLLSKNCIPWLARNYSAGGGSQISNKGLCRDLYLAKSILLADKKNKYSLICRKDDNGLSKAFNCFGGRYNEIPQTMLITLKKLVKLLAKTNDWGNAVTKRWTIGNLYSEIVLVMPALKQSYSIFGRDIDCNMGIKISTSDVMYERFKVKKMLIIGHREICLEEIEISHDHSYSDELCVKTITDFLTEDSFVKFSQNMLSELNDKHYSSKNIKENAFIIERKLMDFSKITSVPLKYRNKESVSRDLSKYPGEKALSQLEVLWIMLMLYDKIPDRKRNETLSKEMGAFLKKIA